MKQRDKLGMIVGGPDVEQKQGGPTSLNFIKNSWSYRTISPGDFLFSTLAGPTSGACMAHR